MICAGTPATFETPSTVQGSPVPKMASSEENNQPCKEHKDKKDNSDLTLDKFFAKNTSEDNESFEQIMENTRKKHREKYEWLYKEEVERKESKVRSLALTEAADGDQFTEENRPGMVQLWSYTNKNALMYVPEGVEDSAKEKIEGKNIKRQQVIHANTRLRQNPYPENTCTEQLAMAAATHNAALQGKIGVDGHLQKPTETPKVNGYGFVGTPSPAPGKWAVVYFIMESFGNKTWDIFPAKTPSDYLEIICTCNIFITRCPEFKEKFPETVFSRQSFVCVCDKTKCKLIFMASVIGWVLILSLAFKRIYLHSS